MASALVFTHDLQTEKCAPVPPDVAGCDMRYKITLMEDGRGEVGDIQGVISRFHSPSLDVARVSGELQSASDGSLQVACTNAHPFCGIPVAQKSGKLHAGMPFSYLSCFEIVNQGRENYGMCIQVLSVCVCVYVSMLAWQSR